MTPEQLILKTIRDIHSEGGHPNLEAIGTEGLSSAAEKFLKILGGLTGEDDTPSKPAQIEGPPPPAATIQFKHPDDARYRFPWNSRTQQLPTIDKTLEFQKLYAQGECPVHNVKMRFSQATNDFACPRVDCTYGYVRD